MVRTTKQNEKMNEFIVYRNNHDNLIDVKCNCNFYDTDYKESINLKS